MTEDCQKHNAAAPIPVPVGVDVAMADNAETMCEGLLAVAVGAGWR